MSSACTIATNFPTVLISIGTRVPILQQRKMFLLIIARSLTYLRSSSVELNIAIICGSMPACSSLAKHVFKESDVFVSFRSILDRYVPSLRSKSRSKKSKASYEVSYPSRIESNQRSMDSRAPLPGNGYMELQDVRSGIRTNEFTAGNPYYQAGRPLEHQQGITKTIQVEIV